MSTDNHLVVPAGEPIPVGGLYLAQPDGSLVRQGDQSTCLASIARGAVRPVVPGVPGAHGVPDTAAETTKAPIASTAPTAEVAVDAASAPTTKPRRA